MTLSAAKPHVGARPGWSVQRLLVALIIAAILVRAGVAVYLGNVANPVSGAADQYSYDVLGQRLAQGHGFSFPSLWYPFTQPNEPTAHWSYLYTGYLAVVYLLFGHQPLVARLIQVVASALMIWLAFRIGRRLFGEWVGLAAAALVASYSYFVFFAAALMTQTFYITALMAAIDLALDLAEQPRLRTWLLLGLALGIGALLRQTLLVFAPLLLLWAWSKGRQAENGGQGKAGLLSAVLGPVASAAVIALLILPWTAYNYVTFHDVLLLNSNGGYWMYSSNHPDQGVDFDGNYAAPLPDDLRGLSEPALDRALYRRGLQFIVDDPQRFVRLSISRIDNYYWLLPSPQSSLLSNLGRVFSFTIYLPFMIYGLWLARRRWRAAAPLLLYVAFDTTLCLLTWAAPRYRLPSDGLLMIFAGLAIVSLAARSRRLAAPNT